MRTRLTFAAILAIGALLLTACAGAQEANPDKLVPASASLIAKFQVAKALEDVDFEALFEAIPKDDGDPQTLDELLGQITGKTGIDVSQFSSAVLFGDVSEIGEDLGLVAAGSFDEDALVAAIEKEGEASLTETEYKGHRIHVDEDEDLALSVLGSDTLVLGTPSAVRSVINVRVGDGDGATGRVYDVFADMGDVLFRLAVQVPPEASRQLDEASPFGDLPFGDFPLDLGVFRDIEIVGATFDKGGEAFTAIAQVDFTSESSASAASDAVDGLLKLWRGLSSDEELRDLLEKVEVSVDKKRVTVRLEVGVSDLEELIDSLEDGTLGLFSGLLRDQPEAAADVTPRPVATPPAQPSRQGPQETGSSVPIEGTAHIPVGETASYRSVPPASGFHWPIWAPCGIYDEELPNELIVHNLEHANVVLSRGGQRLRASQTSDGGEARIQRSRRRLGRDRRVQEWTRSGYGPCWCGFASQTSPTVRGVVRPYSTVQIAPGKQVQPCRKGPGA